MGGHEQNLETGPDWNQGQISLVESGSMMPLAGPAAAAIAYA